MRRLLSLMLLLLIPRCALAQPRLMTRQTSDYFMTASALFLYEESPDEGRFSETWALVKQILSDVESAVSVSIPTSDVARFNALPCGGEMEISPITAELLRVAQDVHALSGGLYDPTVYPLVDLWGFSPRFNLNVYKPVHPYDRAYENGSLPLPDARHVQALLPLVGLSGVELIERDGAFRLKKNTPSVAVDGAVVHAQLDLGGVAKGYACDRVLALLRSRGYTMGHFVCGGSSMALLERPQGDYVLTLRKPRSGETSDTHYAALRARNTTLSTSGDYSHSFVRDGVVYCHIIDPRTGYPINMPDSSAGQSGICAATLLCASAAYGDALTTALCILGPQQAAAFLDAHNPGSAVLAVYRSGEDALSVITNAQSLLTIDDPAYRLTQDGR